MLRCARNDGGETARGRRRGSRGRRRDLDLAQGRQALPGLAAGVAVGRRLGDLAIEPLGLHHVAGKAGQRAGEKQHVGAVGGERPRPGDVGAGAGEIVLAPGERRRKIPGEGIVGDEPERAVELAARGGRIAERDLGAGAVEMDLAAQLVGEVGGQQGGIERGQRPRALARRHPGIAGLDPEIGAAGVIGGFGLARRLLERGRRRPPALERGQSEAEALARGEAAAFAPPGVRRRHRALGVGADLRRAGAVARLDGPARRGGGRAPPPARRRGGIGSGEDGKDAACRAASNRRDWITRTPAASSQWRSAARGRTRATGDGRRP